MRTNEQTNAAKQGLAKQQSDISVTGGAVDVSLTHAPLATCVFFFFFISIFKSPVHLSSSSLGGKKNILYFFVFLVKERSGAEAGLLTVH